MKKPLKNSSMLTNLQSVVGDDFQTNRSVGPDVTFAKRLVAKEGAKADAAPSEEDLI